MRGLSLQAKNILRNISEPSGQLRPDAEQILIEFLRVVYHNGFVSGRKRLNDKTTNRTTSDVSPDTHSP